MPMRNGAKVVWLPGLAAMCISVFSGWLLPRLWPVAGLMFPGGQFGVFVYYPWFLALVAAGALAAYASRRAGGGALHRVAACLFPAAWEFLKILIILAMLPRESLPGEPGTSFALVTRVAVPSLALLLGGAPFLKSPSATRT